LPVLHVVSEEDEAYPTDHDILLIFVKLCHLLIVCHVLAFSFDIGLDIIALASKGADSCD
jgi:hypothetical protein